METNGLGDVDSTLVDALQTPPTGVTTWQTSQLGHRETLCTGPFLFQTDQHIRGSESSSPGKSLVYTPGFFKFTRLLELLWRSLGGSGKGLGCDRGHWLAQGPAETTSWWLCSGVALFPMVAEPNYLRQHKFIFLQFWSSEAQNRFHGQR